MTTYILAGGQDRKSEKYWKNLSKEIKKERPLKVLSCFFSQTEDDWNDKFEGFKDYFKIAFGEDSKFELARVSDFEKQVQDSDIIYLHGGTTKLLSDKLNKFSNIEKLFVNKIIIGSSAGANYLSTICWSPSIQKVIKGSGIIPVAVMVHYGSKFDGEVNLQQSDWDKAEKDILDLNTNDLPIVRLREGEFKIFKK